MMDEPIHRGGCLCGAVRYQARGEPVGVAHCHCQSCRRATGGAVATWAGFPMDRVEVIAGEIARYASSPGVERGFCGTCGSPLSYQGAAFGTDIYLTIGSFDEPGALPPTSHTFTEERIPWLHVDENLTQSPES